MRRAKMIMMIASVVCFMAMSSACSDSAELTTPEPTPVVDPVPEPDCYIDDDCPVGLICKEGACVMSVPFLIVPPRIVEVDSSVRLGNATALLTQRIPIYYVEAMLAGQTTAQAKKAEKCDIDSFDLSDWAKERIKQAVLKVGGDCTLVKELDLKGFYQNNSGDWFVYDYEQKIFNLAWVSNFSNLISLDLSYNRIVDVTPLSELKLRSLKLNYNEIVEIGSLADNDVIISSGVFDISENCLSVKSLNSEGYFRGRGLTDGDDDPDTDMFDPQRDAVECVQD